MSSNAGVLKDFGGYGGTLAVSESSSTDEVLVLILICDALFFDDL